MNKKKEWLIYFLLDYAGLHLLRLLTDEIIQKSRCFVSVLELIAFGELCGSVVSGIFSYLSTKNGSILIVFANQFPSFQKTREKRYQSLRLITEILCPWGKDYFRLGILYANNNFLPFIMITNPTILFLNRSDRYLQTLTTSMSTRWKTKIVSQLVWFTF